MKRFIKMSSVTVFLLASSAYGLEFNFLKDVKAQYEQTLKEAEEKQKNPEEYEKKLRAEWIREIKDACTQATKMMAVKYTDTPEEIKAKYDNADKIIENVYKSFDALYKKQIQNIGYSKSGETYYRNIRIGNPSIYLGSYLRINFGANGNIYYTSIDGEPSGDIKINKEYYLESTYNLEPILEFYLYRIGGTYREQNRLQDAFNSAVKFLTSRYKNGLNNAYNTYTERQEEMTLNNWYSIGVYQAEIQSWKDAGLSFEDAKKWANIYNGKVYTSAVLKLIANDISLDDAKQWSEVYKNITNSSDSVNSVLQWINAGISPEVAKKWVDLFTETNYRGSAMDWINASISPEDAREWIDLYNKTNYGGGVMDWINAGTSLEDAKKWVDLFKETNYNGSAMDWIKAGISPDDAKKWFDLYKETNYSGDILEIIQSGISFEDAQNWLEVTLIYQPTVIIELKKNGMTKSQDFFDWQEINESIRPEQITDLCKIGFDKPSKVKPFLKFVREYKTDEFVKLLDLISELNKVFKAGIKTSKEYEIYLEKETKKREKANAAYQKEASKYKKVCEDWLANAHRMTYLLGVGDEVKSQNGVTYRILGNYNTTFLVQLGGTQFHLQKSTSLPADTTPPNKYCHY